MTDLRQHAPGRANPPTEPLTVPATVLVGNPRRGSRTLTVARHLTGALRAGLADLGVHIGDPYLVDLAELGADLPARLIAGTAAHAPLERVLDRVRGPGLLVVVSPTFKGSYTGLLKLFLDMLPREGLSPGTVAVPVMTAGWAQHRFVSDARLRPLLVELGAVVPVRGLAVLEEEFGDLDTAVAGWTAAAVPVLAAVLRSCQTPAVSPTRLAEPVPVHQPAQLR
ncbi:NADPH-dependent oxidoreductase [Micromonospora craterilacus]|uniref:NADPH-dependent oxidoreductase n=1 Tax=Micromonospora craterilacus TaxID=1655439 RepID=A0A2W2F276_9ACTN|nr:NAD(P)H-dependent oxidoreductase [Micromonospora craterilacus]PZG19900.1 NADPH-dependent oxidoreductase [Micromonospora craterilacus]